MNKKFLALLITASTTLIACGPTQPSNTHSSSTTAMVEKGLSQVTQTNIDDIAATLDVKYKVLTNIPTDKCDKNIADGSCFEVELIFTASQAITSKDWSIHFSQIAPIQSFESDEFSVQHINGDLHKVSLKNNYLGFKAGETKTLVFRANFWMLSETDALPNYIVAAEQLKERVIVSTIPKIDADSGLELLPFVVPFTDVDKQFKRTKNDATSWLNSKTLYQRNTAISNTAYLSDSENIEPLEKLADVSHVIIPTPKSVQYDENKGYINIENGLNIQLGNVNEADVKAAVDRLAILGIKNSATGVPLRLNLVADETKAIGSYTLDITSTVINIIGVDGNGVFNGLQSLASLATVGSSTLPLLKVADEPHYAFRGMLVDVARNFHSKDFILKLLDQMAAYKLNKLHLHLGDDEGWRLEIPSLPELTEVGSKRCFDSQEQDCLMPMLGAGIDEQADVNGYYTVSDYQEILKAASARHIQVIPSLDMPGHSRSSIKAMTARYNKYKALEDDEKATQFLLHDIEDKTQYSSVQYYNDNTINVCLESAYAFVIEVMTQVKKIHAEGGQPLTRYHIGADETAGAWVDSPVCKAFVENNEYGVTDISQVGPYFIERVAGILSELGIETAGWSDGLSHTKKDNMPAVVQANAWDVLSWGGHSNVNKLANQDWQIVISSPDVLYFDFPYESDPKEHGYYWASRHINTEKIFQFIPDNLPVHAEFWLDREDNSYSADDTLQKDQQGKIISQPLAQGIKFLGLQGQLWSENTRNDDMVEHKIFPRLLALAERAWYLPAWAVPYNYQGFKYNGETEIFTKERRQARDLQWRLFANTLGQKEFTKLDLADISYRLPTVGAMVENGLLFANISFPGLLIQYQEQDGQWQVYQGPVAVKGNVKVRSKNKTGTRTSRETEVYQP